LAAAVACLLLVSLTAATEAVLAQITRQQLRQGLSEEGRAARSVESLIARPRAYGSAMTLLHTVGSVAFVLLLTSLFQRQGIAGAFWIAFGIGSGLLLLLGHSVPRGLARRSVERAATGLSGFAVLATTLAFPFLLLYDGLTRVGLLIARRPRPAPPQEPIDEEELRAVLGPEYSDNEQIEEAEREMIDAILDLEDRTARDIMVPRLDIVAVPEDAALADVVAIIRREGHSRVPVYRGSIDNIVGVLYAKDLLRFIARDAAPIALADLARPIDRNLIVPESKQVDVLLREMRSRKHHLALVLDEYGGTAGILTIEDILEEIVGDINDEHDRNTEPEIQEISDRELLVDARIGAGEVSDWLHLHWERDWEEDEEHATIGGLIQRELGRLPTAGEQVEIDGAQITVLAVEGHRLKRLRVEKLLPRNGTAPDADTSDGVAAERTESLSDNSTAAK
jgi:CBS domain containing-hemolysin-like protein